MWHLVKDQLWHTHVQVGYTRHHFVILTHSNIMLHVTIPFLMMLLTQLWPFLPFQNKHKH